MLKCKRFASRGFALVLALWMLYTPDAFAATTYSTLAFGSRGTDVLKLQKALQTLGYDPNGTDGKFGRGTEAAVMLYQSAKGLVSDGKAGNLTLTALYTDAENASTSDTSSDSSSGSATSSGTRVSSNPNTLEYGDSGDKVTALQTALVKLGYSTNGVDGRFGAATQKAVIAFQKANGLTADGLAGSSTQNLLYQKADSASGSTAGNSTDNNSGSNASSSSGFTRTLRKGYTGTDVSSVQAQLQSLGYYSGSLDGVYGSGTMSTINSRCGRGFAAICKTGLLAGSVRQE